jgi:cytochrome c oxidase subunit 2
VRGAAQSVLDQAGPFSAHIAQLFWVFVGIAVVVYVAVAGFVIHALRRRKAAQPASGNSPVALRAIATAVGLTAIVLLGLGITDFLAGRALVRAADGAMRVRVTAHQWWWEIEYLDGVPSQRVRTANELHIPVGRPVALELGSNDVIHSFWVPSLQGKKDLLPGYTTSLQLIASRPGVYRGECAEFCGFQHAHMSISVHAHEPADYTQWQDAQRRAAREPAGALQKRGREVFMGASCPQCHTVRGTDAGAVLGPDLTHVASRAEIAAGTLPNNPANLAAWIADPQRLKPGTRMPSTPLSSADSGALVAYLASLR